MSMPSRTRRIVLAALGSLALGLAQGCGPARGQDRGQSPQPPAEPRTLFDPGLAELRKASATWEFRRGPTRRVADVVCLVPDVPTFLQAIATWDEGHAFPILIEDAEFTPRFLRAFRPAQVVRFPEQAEPIAEADLWDAAVAAVGRAWVDEAQSGAAAPAGDAVPKLARPTPPGLVLSAPDSPALAGAVALAAGHFQPLRRLDVDRGPDDVLPMEEAIRLVNDVQEAVARVIPEYDVLGDACDFLTLAGDWPYRYQLDEGPEQIRGTAALDDLIGRAGPPPRRWAYVGRLIGDERTSLYRAMCALFLQPESTLLFNAYDEKSQPWAAYDMRSAARRLAGEGLRVAHVAGPEQADLAGWHRALDPVNRAGLVLINTSGNPTDFNLQGGQRGHTADVPPTDPAALLVIHSFSAANPYDPGTLAGRWLANGAFVYFGAINEPYLNAFRTPTLVANLIAEYLPLVAAVRRTPNELFGHPWRLIYLGDPLYRLRPPEQRSARIENWAAVADWPAHAVPAIPTGPAVSEEAKLDWTWSKTIASAARGSAAGPEEILTRAVLAIRRDGLPADRRPTYDALLADALLPYSDRTPLRRAYAGMPAGEVPPEARRWIETGLVADLQRAIDTLSPVELGNAWSAVLAADVDPAVQALATARAGAAFETRGRQRDWLTRLHAALRADPTSETLRTEVRRVEEALREQPAPGAAATGR